jgi:hypothetical protein
VTLSFKRLETDSALMGSDGQHVTDRGREGMRGFLRLVDVQLVWLPVARIMTRSLLCRGLILRREYDISRSKGIRPVLRVVDRLGGKSSS